MANRLLDDLKLFKQYDAEDMLTHLHHMPQLCQDAWQRAMNFDLPLDYASTDKVVILGMGGSAIGGDLVASLVSSEAKLPIIIRRDYDLPTFVDVKTLVIASSYSGNTEETLAAFNKALKTAAKKLVITTNGKLQAEAQIKGVPVFNFNYKAPPRAALPYSVMPLLCFLHRLGFIADKSKDVFEAISVLRKLSLELRKDVPQLQNPAKLLANRLHNQLPVVYGAGIVAEVAHRWKTQLNENSKAWAFYEVFPELNHNAVVGYQFPVELANKIVVVLLGSTHLPKRITLRYRITCQLLEMAGVSYQTIDGDGEYPLSQVMSLVLFGDYVSYYLAILYKTDPTPVKAIDLLKRKLADY